MSNLNENDELNNLNKVLFETSQILENTEIELKTIQEKINFLKKKQRRIKKIIDITNCKKINKINVNIIIDFD